MYDFLLLVALNIIVAPLAYLAGYKLRHIVPRNRRFPIGFTIVLIILTLALLLSLEFETIRLTQPMAIAIAIGFPLGIAGPPFIDSKR